MTLSDCNNTWQLLAGESLVPCVVQAPQSVSDHSFDDLIQIKGNSIEWKGKSDITIDMISIDGRALIDPTELTINVRLNVPQWATGTYIIRASDGQNHWHRLINRN